VAAYAALAVPAFAREQVFVEAEQFGDCGGWDLDQQFMDQMGSPYLLAHGLGVPVRDAVTTVKFPTPGTYRVWVRTRDWVAPWKSPGAPGKFQLLIDGKPLVTTFGTEGAEWHWQDGGTVNVGKEAKLALHDLTGFEGRCDAIVFSSDLDFQPPNEKAELATWRRQQLGLPESAEDGGTYDLVVIGGGIAGSAAAVTAARLGLTVALIQDRPVLGGNGSSEVRVWPEGHTNQEPYPRIGDVVRELVPDRTKAAGNAKSGAVYEDQRKSDLVGDEPKITLLLEQRVFVAETEHGKLTSVTAQHTRSARRTKLRGRFFADCTGDGTVGYLAGADHDITERGHMGVSNMWNLLDASDEKQVLVCECKDKDALAVAFQQGNVAVPFPRCPWAIDLSDKPFPGRKKFIGQGRAHEKPLDNLGGWFWESGFDRDPIEDVERMRDLNFRAMYGAWDALKNVDKLYPNHRIGWAAFIAGKRESRRLLGDVVLSADDFRNQKQFPDAAFPCSWHIDLHLPEKEFQDGHEGNEFISRATEGAGYRYKGPYWAPYRCLYSRNLSNLFMAGRDISVNHDALGAVRVMRTCGMMGEVVGMAASLCRQHDTTPRGVYADYLQDLKALMKRGAGKEALKLSGGSTN
jgi:hypothetical protein